MYEDYEQNIAAANEDSGSIPGVSADLSDNHWNGTFAVSSGDAGSDAGGFDGFDYDKFAESLSVVMSGSVSGPDSDDIISLVQEEVLENLQALNTSVQALSTVVSLVFAYLLLDWTSRKLLAVVNRFTGRRK